MRALSGESQSQAAYHGNAPIWQALQAFTTT